MNDLKSTNASNNTESGMESFIPFIPCFITAGLVIMINNILVILTIHFTPKLRTISNIYVANLAVADLLIGIFKVPTYILLEISSASLEGMVLIIYYVIDAWIFALSSWSLVAISADRYVAVTKPLYYQKVSSQLAYLFVISLWILTLLVAVLIEIGGAYWYGDFEEFGRSNVYVAIMLSIMFCVPLLLMLYFYWEIYKVAIKTTNVINRNIPTANNTLNCNDRLERYAKLRRADTDNINVSYDESHNSLSADNDMPGNRSLKAPRATKAVLIIIGLFLLANVPFWTLWLINVYGTHVEVIEIFYAFDLLAFCCSAFNPFVYALAHKVFRDGLKRLLCKCSK